MSESIEIEYKSLLTQKEFNTIRTYYQFQDHSFKKQSNYYFDSAEMVLKNRGFGLRIRTFPEKAELTLKTPAEHGLLETTDSLTLTEAEALLKADQILLTGQVAAKLTAEGIAPDTLHLFADLTTARAERRIREGLLALDESWYGSTGHDYELELEVSDPQKGELAFQQLLARFGVEFKPAVNKISRAFKELQK